MWIRWTTSSENLSCSLAIAIAYNKAVVPINDFYSYHVATYIGFPPHEITFSIEHLNNYMLGIKRVAIPLSSIYFIVHLHSPDLIHMSHMLLQSRFLLIRLMEGVLLSR